MIDRKFKFVAVNPCNNKVYTEENAFIICAKDAAALAALKGYMEKCLELGTDSIHIQSIDMMANRIDMFQRKNGSRVPDTNTDCEIDRCIGGVIK